MSKEKFVLVSLKEDKAKKLAQVISNDSCRRILDHLADKESTESDLAHDLHLPISTVHYNLKQLMVGGMVECEEFHYSKKGKEINHYKLANKYIIIAPKSTYGIKEKLKSILPVALLIAAGGFIIQYVDSGMNFLSRGFTRVTEVSEMVTSKAADVSQPVAERAGVSSATSSGQGVVVQKISTDAASSASQVIADEAIVTTTRTFVEEANRNLFSYSATWFVIGAIFAIVLYLIIDKIRK